jgi:hypothetical protein
VDIEQWKGSSMNCQELSGGYEIPRQEGSHTEGGRRLKDWRERAVKTLV